MSEKQYIVSARKYRPATFKSVVGQRALTATLKNAIEQKRLAQAYLFTGPRGVGKTSCARIFAKTINCLSPTSDGEACGQCESCRAIENGSSFNIIELDAASNNSVDDIRNINEQVNIPPQVGSYRVFIIDEVHMLSTSAFNAFLKTLEEPPKYAIFILATTEKHKVIPTILSRCQIYDFKRITVNDMVEHLKYVAETEGIKAETAALGVIARKADGAMRDALSIFDQVAASSRGEITYQSTIDNLNVLDYEVYFNLVDAFCRGDVADALVLYKQVRDRGFDSHFFVNGLAQHVRDLMVAADPKTIPLLEVADDVSAKLVEQAKALPPQWYYAALKLLAECDLNYRTATNKQLLVELTLVRLSQLLTPATPPFDRLDYTPPMRSLDPVAATTATTTGTSAAVRPQHGESAAKVTSGPTATAVSPAPQQGGTHPANGGSTVTAQGNISNQQNVARASGATGGIPRLKTKRLSDMRAMKPTDTLEERSNPVDLEHFMQAWRNFININSDLHILTSAMRGASPVQSTPTEFTIAVGHPAQQQAFESSMPKLLAALRNELGNDLITIKVLIDTTKDVARMLPPQEFLRKAVEENPVLGEFLSEIEAEL